MKSIWVIGIVLGVLAALAAFSATATEIQTGSCGNDVTATFSIMGLSPSTHYDVFADGERLTGFTTGDDGWHFMTHESTLPAGSYSWLVIVGGDQVVRARSEFTVSGVPCGFWTGAHHTPAPRVVPEVAITPLHPKKVKPLPVEQDRQGGI